MPFLYPTNSNRDTTANYYIYMHVHCTNTHLIAIQHLANIGISRSLTTLHRLILYAPYPTSPSAKSFHSLLTTILYIYDTNHHTAIQSTKRYPIYPQYITPTHTPRRRRFIITDSNKWVDAPHNICPNNLTLLVYTHSLVTSLSPITTLVLQ